MNATATNTYGITDEINQIMQLAVSDTANLRNMLLVIQSMLTKCLANKADAKEVLEISQAVIAAVADWMRDLEKNQPVGRVVNARLIANSLRMRLPGYANASPSIQTDLDAIKDAPVDNLDGVLDLLDRAKKIIQQFLAGKAKKEETARTIEAMIAGLQSWMDTEGSPLAVIANARTVGNLRSHLLSINSTAGISRPVVPDQRPDRESVIAKADADYDAESDQSRRYCSKSVYVDQRLREAGYPLLTDDEKRNYPVR